MDKSEISGLGKRLALSSLSIVGAFRLGELLGSRHLPVLTYHRVIPRNGRKGENRPSNTHFTDEFEAQMDFVARRFHVLSGDELYEYMSVGRGLPRYALAVTFDDGYENNFLHALPVLQRRGLHAVFFVTANLIGSDNRSLWFDRLDRLLAAVPAATILERLRRIDSSVPAGSGVRVHRHFKQLSHMRQSELLDGLEQEFRHAAVPAADRSLHCLMTWDQVRSMALAGMTIGSHTANHQILAAVPSADVERELVSSRERIERETGRPCWCFAYPNGERRDFRPADEAAVARAGYLCAFTQIPGAVDGRSPRFALPRVPIPDTGDMKVFRSYVSGVQRVFRRVFPA